MSKPTQEQIVAALRCRTGAIVVDCGKCPYERDCDEPLWEDAADLIESQAARIRELEAGYIAEVVPVLKAMDSEELNEMGKVEPEDVPEVQRRLNQMYAQHERTPEEWQAAAQYKPTFVKCEECRYAEEVSERLVRCRRPRHGDETPIVHEYRKCAYGKVKTDDD